MANHAEQVRAAQGINIQAKLTIAEIETKAQNLSEQLAFVDEFIKQQHAQGHEVGMQAMDPGHERPGRAAAGRPGMSQASDQAHQMGITQVEHPLEGKCQ